MQIFEASDLISKCTLDAFYILDFWNFMSNIFTKCTYFFWFWKCDYSSLDSENILSGSNHVPQLFPIKIQFFHLKYFTCLIIPHSRIVGGQWALTLWLYHIRYSIICLLPYMTAKFQLIITYWPGILLTLIQYFIFFYFWCIIICSIKNGWELGCMI